MRVTHASIPWIEADLVSGFSHLQRMLAPERQHELVSAIDAEEGRWEKDDTRMRQYYGYRYHYENDTLSKIGDAALPQWLLRWVRFVRAQGWMSALAEQVTVQKYATQSSMGAHRDSVRCFGPDIVTISLVSSCDLCLTHARDRRKLSRRLEPGDVFLLTGEARFVWRHEILPNSRDVAEGLDWRRLSVTFRTVNRGRIR